MVVEIELFLRGLESIEEAVTSFLQLCFVCHLEYRYLKSAGILCTFLQRWVAKRDEFGHKSVGKSDLACKADKSGRSFKKVFEDYSAKVYRYALTREK